MSPLIQPVGDRERWCKDGLLADYLEYTAAQESPEDFHLWIALGLISSVLSRNVWTPRGFFQLYPNLYIVLVGDSGVVRKSTALNIGLGVLREAMPSMGMISEKLTTQALFNFLSEERKNRGKSVGTLVSPELKVFLGESSRDPQLLPILTDLYDCPDSRIYTTMTRGKEEVKDAYIVMLAGTTEEWFKTSLSEESVGGGFTSRLLMIHKQETEKAKVAFPEDMAPEAMKCRDNVIHDLRVISTLKGPFRWDREAKEWFESWYGLYDVRRHIPQMRGYASRKQDYLTKLAMLVSISKNDTLTLTKDDFLIASKFLGSIEGSMTKLVSHMEMTEEGEKVQRVLSVIASERVVEHGALLRKVGRRMNGLTLMNVIGTLMEMGEIERSNKDGKRYYTYKGGK